jgi:hypothetical protein
MPVVERVEDAAGGPSKSWPRRAQKAQKRLAPQAVIPCPLPGAGPRTSHQRGHGTRMPMVERVEDAGTNNLPLTHIEISELRGSSFH